LPGGEELIAVVDDDPSVCTALGRLLRSAGYSSEGFAGGAVFLTSLQSRRPDCIVLDLEMPDVTGFNVLERLANSETRIPVVILTGCDTPEARRRAKAAGVVAFLCKPVDYQALLDAIAAGIARRPPENRP
jgi:FixJ family two-component response regulator